MKAGKPKRFEAPFYVFWTKSAPITLTIPDGHRLVVFSMDQQPSIVPADVMPMGRYEFQPEPLPGGTYPIGIQVLPLAHAKLVERLPADKVSDILKATTPKHPPHGGLKGFGG